MDSITQAALGASVAHACWHGQLGRRALLWGAALGTLPDLDVVLYPLLDDVQRLYWHRGESHSAFFVLLGGLLVGWLLQKKRWNERMTLFRAVAGVLLIFASHVAIDAFNMYGTQLLAPLSRHGFALGNLFIIDPLYTVPLLAGVIVAAAMKGRTGMRANRAALVVSCLYVLFSLGSHTYADHIFRSQLEASSVPVIHSITSATPMNTLLWRHVARTREGILVGYFSILADHPRDPIRFDLALRNEHLLEPYRDQRNLRAAEWFSQGFWVAREQGGVVTLSDLRFGELRQDAQDPPEMWQFVFTWVISEDPVTLERPTMEIDDPAAAARVLWDRLTAD